MIMLLCCFGSILSLLLLLCRSLKTSELVLQILTLSFSLSYYMCFLPLYVISASLVKDYIT
jgi:hypothetical protein